MSEGGVTLEIEEIDKYQFVDVPILIKANLVDTAANQRKLGETSNVKVLLAFEGNASVEHRCREHHPNLLEVISNSGIQEDGTAKIEIKIKDVSMNHENQKFVVYLEAYRPHGESNIICAISNPITCVRHKLVLSEAYNAPYIWYKDEGAKDKCIRILVKLIDSNKNLVKDRNIVLVPTLIYSSGLPVQPSNVLNLFHDREKPFMIGHNGTDVIRYRVNEVSRNHRKQLFHLLVAPDLSANPSAADISPAISLAFEVKSKRTSDAKKEQMSVKNDDDSSDEMPSVNIPAQLLTEKLTTELPKPMNIPSIKTLESDHKSIQSTSITPRTGSNEQKLGKRPISYQETASIPSANDNENAMRSIYATNDHPGRNLQISTAPLNPNRDSEMHRGHPSSLGHDETIDTPLQALNHMTDWMNAAYSTLCTVRTARSSPRSNAENIDDLLNSLVDVFPMRTVGSIQFLQQFLAIHEGYLVQQNQLVFQYYQQQQMSLAGRHDPAGSGRPYGYPPMVVGNGGRLNTGNPGVSSFPLHPTGSLPATSPYTAAATSRPKMDMPGPGRNVRGQPFPNGMMNDPLAMNRFPRHLPYDLKRRRVNDSEPAIVNSSSGSASVQSPSIESYVNIVVAKYLRLPKDDHKDGFLGLPAYSTYFPPPRLVGFYQKVNYRTPSANGPDEWIFKPFQAIAIFSDFDFGGVIYDEITDLLENNELIQQGFIFDTARFQSNLSLLKRELFANFSDFDPESPRSSSDVERVLHLKMKKN